MNTDVMFSSKTDQWSTPQGFFDSLNREFSFTLDPCADESNHKCDRYFTIEDDGLKQDWGAKWFFATHLTAEQLRTGSERVVKRFKNQTRLSSC